MLAGGGQVVQLSRVMPAIPDRQAVRAHDCLDVGTEVAVLSGVPGVDHFPFHAGGRFSAAVGGEDLAVEDDVGQPSVGDSVAGRRAGPARWRSGPGWPRRGSGRRWPVRSRTRRRAGAGLRFAVPDEHEQGVIPAGQGPGVFPRAGMRRSAASSPARWRTQFPGDVEHGTIGDHVGSSRRPVALW